MRVVTTAPKDGLDLYGHRWLESRENWPDAEFVWYTENYELDEVKTKDFRDLPEFHQWKMKHARYAPPSWQWDVVAYAHKVFAACDALYDYDGVGVWLDADCVTFKPIPEGLIEAQVKDAYLACYQRTGMYTETGFWVMDCSHPEHKAFLDAWRSLYFSERYTKLPQWHDCFTLDATIRLFADKIKVHNLSGKFAKDMHPMASSELGQYIDHCKGPRKIKGISPENKFRSAA